jgi:hypothetical protein
VSPRILWLFLAGSTLSFGAYSAVAQSVSRSNTEIGETYGNGCDPGGWMESSGLAISGWNVDHPVANHDTATPTRKRSDDWEFSLSSYLCMTSLRAETEEGSVSRTAEACFSELLPQMDMGAQMRFEGPRHWGFYLDGTCTSLGGDARRGPTTPKSSN